ncbi:nucleotidyltransferase family protein [Beggiatoa leptomitoformis]|nr:nucleotidyltransferase family protein [Beggiatoa leptomitoformis]
MSPTCILLAAGNSQRFGSPKLLHPVAQQTPLILMTARLLQSVVKQLIIVVRPEDIALQTVVSAAGYHCLPCSEARLGMGHSLACGVRASAGAEAWLVALADMPFIQVQTLQQLTAGLAQGAALIAPFYQGKRGHPVGFARQFYPQLCQLTGDNGARTIIEAHHAALVRVVCDDAGILQDIDTPADLPTAQK